MNEEATWNEIETLDNELGELLNRRATLSKELGSQTDSETRYAELVLRSTTTLKRAMNNGSGPMPAERMLEISRRINDAYVSLLKTERVRVAALGPPGSYTHLAASKIFGDCGEYELLPNIKDVFAALRSGETRYAVTAVGNSIAGPVGENLDLLAQCVTESLTGEMSRIAICTAMSMRIEHCLVGVGTPSSIRSIRSHNQGLDQCRCSIQRFLATHGLNNVALISDSSTSEAARQAARDPSIAAIANRLTAELWGVRIIQEDMADDATNETKFFVLGRDHFPQFGKCRTLLWFRCEHRPGALVDILTPISKRDLNMTMIVSRPIYNEPWAFSFFVELDGHVDDPTVSEAIELMKPRCVSGHPILLGSYSNNSPSYR